MRTARITVVVALVLAGPASAAFAPPRLTNPGAWLQKREAPADTLKQGDRALTVFDLTIAQDGSIVTCEIALPSKSAVLDQYACSLFKQHARYESLKSESENNTLRKRRDFLIWESSKSAYDGVSKASAAIPASGAGLWVTTDDLPKGTLAPDQVVASNVALTISPDGRVIACDVTLPSERPDLDQRVCDLMLARAHYKAARDADGKPIEGVDWVTIRWQVPRD